jgi:hypothetical protein
MASTHTDNRNVAFYTTSPVPSAATTAYPSMQTHESYTYTPSIDYKNTEYNHLPIRTEAPLVPAPVEGEVQYRWVCHMCGGDNSCTYNPSCTSGINGNCGHILTDNDSQCPQCRVYGIET